MGAAYTKTSFPIQNPASAGPSLDHRAPSSGSTPDGEDGSARPIPADAGGAESPHTVLQSEPWIPVLILRFVVILEGGAEASLGVLQAVEDIDTSQEAG